MAAAADRQRVPRVEPTRAVRSLTRHLTADTAAHKRLKYHPDRPRCRAERLAGTPGSESRVSTDASGLAAGLLAFSAGSPPAAAQVPGMEPEHQEAPTPDGEPPGLQPE
ncbi:MAG TPA: hypothetical protein VE270_03005, partial [Thermoleophilaceae bacterium]|nr:hypothetical protein [Thermoleophilaceae bacterium]